MPTLGVQDFQLIAPLTGASRGIGRASAQALARAGAQVLVHYGRGAREAEAVIAEIRKAGGRADAITADLLQQPPSIAAQQSGGGNGDVSRVTDVPFHKAIRWVRMVV
jgi:NAD(P)-dependent dehydrogenase (short-subunit alcohol dehydrogenase family)